MNKILLSEIDLCIKFASQNKAGLCYFPDPNFSKIQHFDFEKVFHLKSENRNVEFEVLLYCIENRRKIETWEQFFSVWKK